MRILDEQWKRISRLVFWSSWLRKCALVFVGAILPIIESVLCSLLAAAGIGNQGILVACMLLTVGLLHVLLLIGLLFGETDENGKQTILAAEIGNELENTKTELARRKTAYRSFRTAYSKLNNEVCRIKDWCQEGFQDEFDSIIQVIRNDIRTTLGVTHDQYTIEIICDEDVVECCSKRGNGTRPRIGGMELVYFSSVREVTEDMAVALNQHAPASIGRHKDVAMQQTVLGAPESYIENGEPKKGVYFCRWAAVPVKMICSEESQ